MPEEKPSKFRATPPVMFILKDVRHLEHDPHSQYKFNRFWAIIWFVTIIAAAIALWPSNRTQFVQLLILEVSLWANFATHFGAMSAALAASNTSQDTKEMAEDLDTMAKVAEKMDEIVPPLRDDTIKP